MRKKYLSALLFGALLFASAGTFTSCKDYDDDIKNLQEQIDQVVKDLESLKTTVESLGGVTDVKVEGNKLIVTTAGDKTVSYDLPSGTEMEEIKIENGHLYVGDEDKGVVGGSVVTVNENGELMIDGKEAGLKVGTEVVIMDNSNGVCTIKIGDEEVQLATAATFVTVETVGITKFVGVANNSNGIAWGYSTKEVKWNGPKGNIAPNQLLVGQISDVQVSVLPASYDLSKQELKFVNSNGEYAKVNVSAVSANDLIVDGSRSNSSNLWDLDIQMTEEITKDNVGKAFANADNTANVKYALSVNGTLVSGYDFVIDTEKTKTTQSTTYKVGNAIVNGEKLTNNSITVPVGESTFEYEDEKVYDYYLAISEEDINDAEAWGISVENNKIIANESAAGREIKLVVNVIDVNGNTITNGTQTLTLKIEGSVVAPEDVTPVEYKVGADQSTNSVKFTVDLGSTFTGLTPEEAISITDIEWVNDAEANANFLFLNEPTPIYKDAEDKPVTGLDNAINIKKIETVELSSNSLNKDAKPGKYNLTLRLLNGANEVKKVNVPVNVTLPTFAELFSNRPTLVDGLATVVLDGITADAAPKYNVSEIFAKKADGTKWNNLDLKSNVEKTATITDATDDTSSPIIVFDKVNNIDNGAVKKNANISGTYYLVNSQYEGLAVEVPAFDVKFVSPFADMKFDFYKDDKVIDVIPVTVDASGNATIEDYQPKVGSTKAKGLALSAYKQLTKAFNNSYTEYGITSSNVKLEITDGNASLATDGIALSGMSKSASYDATITVTVTDLNGIKTTKDIKLRVN